MQRLIPDKYVNELLCSPELASSFIEWYVWQTVDSFGSVGLGEIGHAVAENYPVSVKAVRDYCQKTLYKESCHAYRLTKEMSEILGKVAAFRDYFRQFSEDKGNGVYLTIHNAITHREGETALVCAAIARMDQIETGRKDVDYQTLFFDYLRYGRTQVDELKESLAHILPENRKIPLHTLFVNDKIIRALNFGNVRDTESFLKCDFDSLADVLHLDFKDVIPVLKGLSRPAKDMLHEAVGAYLTALANKSQSRLYSFVHRYGVGKENGREGEETLEEIGQGLGMTRERARQLIARAEEILESYAPQMLTYGAIALRKEFGEYRIRTSKEARPAFHCLEDLHVFSVAAELYGDARVSYNESLDIFYEPYATRIHDLKFQVLDGLDDLLSPKEFDSKREFEKRIILTEYSKRESGFYLRKGKPGSYMITRIIDRFFPSGYHVGEGRNQDYDDLCKCLRQAYGIDYPLPNTAHAVEAIIANSGYCLVGKGTYVNRLFVNEPDITLLSQIFAYVEDNGPMVYYDSVFEKFKDEFGVLGVDNAFYAKGLIDPYLRDHGFHTKRNYVQLEKGGATAREVLYEFMRAQNEPFTIQDLRNRFPGVKDYVFLFAIEDSGDILLCDKSEYISLAKSGMTEEGKRLLIEAIDEAILAGNGVTNTHRIYGRLQLFHRGYEKEFGFLKSQRGIFSYAQRLSELNEKYEFSRPFISNKGSGSLTKETVLANHLLQMESFTIQDCHAYLKKTGGSVGNFSFIGFMDSLSDDFVLVDRYTAVRKDKFLISEAQLDKVRNMFLMFVRTRGEFDSKDTAALSYFPQIIAGYDLNAYLLLGIVQTFLSEYFSVEIEAFGMTVNYIIKEVK